MLDWLGQLNEEERIAVIRDAFAQVAKTQPGEVVFAVLFEQLYMFRPCKDAEAVALSNFAKHLLSYFGEDVQVKIVEAVLANAKRASLNIPLEGKKENG
jgi:hypothetical protein